MLWVAFGLLFPDKGTRHPMASAGLTLVGLVYLMILSGGLVAGTRAGFAYSTWPLMGTTFIPPGLYADTPAWMSAFDDITTIQFNHRIFAYAIFLLVHVFAFLSWRRGLSGRAGLAVSLLLAAVWLQVCLGISTLLLHVPVPLAAAHQGGAILLLSATLFAAWSLLHEKPLFHERRSEAVTA